MSRGSYTFNVRTYECGPDGFVSLASICNYLQEAASINASELGFSKSNYDSQGKNVSWVLTRLSIRMQSYPRWEESVMVETFPRGGRKIVAWRDFELKNARGERIGVASSEWMMIDLSTRKITSIPDDVLACIDPNDVPVLGDNPFEKLRFPDEGSLISKSLMFKTQKSHIDLNGHVNNVHYVEWMLEPSDKMHPREIDITFKSEALAGDDVVAKICANDSECFHSVSSPSGKEHIIARTSFFVEE
jgi:acyl-ACP thioesterase